MVFPVVHPKVIAEYLFLEWNHS